MANKKHLGLFIRQNWFLVAAFAGCFAMLAVNIYQGRWGAVAGSLAILAFIVITNSVILFWPVGKKKPKGVAEYDDIPLNDHTQAMIGHWALKGEVVLIVAEVNSSVRLSVPQNDTWCCVISEAKVVGETVCFTQKGYLLDGTRHAFNGCPSLSRLKLVDSNTLELAIKTDGSPTFEAATLDRTQIAG